MLRRTSSGFVVLLAGTAIACGATAAISTYAGAGRELSRDQLRAAAADYVASIEPGNTAPLDDAVEQYAAYLQAFHRQLHVQFAAGYLAGLPPYGPLSDAALVTKVEIVLEPDGSIHRLGSVCNSGNLSYEFGALQAVYRGAPYPPPPASIRSPDGRTYLRWSLHRSASQCGTWNAEPYILRSVPSRSRSGPKPRCTLDAMSQTVSP